MLLALPLVARDGVSIDFQRFHQLMEERFGAGRVRESQAWEKMLQDIALLPDREKALRVSRFLHRRLKYAEDERLWGEDDYWATPLETLGQGRGDCEDWAIAKYFSLRAAGIEDRNLRLIYASIRRNDFGTTVTEAHMVLGYYPQPTAEPLILDNLNHRVLPASQRPDLTPVFSFNSAGLWVGQRAMPSTGKASAPLSRWRDVLERVQREGMSW